MRHRQTDPAQQLNALSYRIHKFNLLGKVLVIQKMKLVKGRPGNLPMRFLIKIAQRDAVDEQHVESVRHFEPHRLLEFKRKQLGNGAVGLDLWRTLMQSGLSCDSGSDVELFVFRHGSSPCRNPTSSRDSMRRRGRATTRQ